LSRKPFEQIVAEHGATVLRVCRGVLGPHTEADDAWSETFLAALKTWPDLPEDANVEAWLVTIAHRKAVDVTRARQRHAVASDALSEHPSGIGIPGQDDTDIWYAVQALPDRQRQAVAYHYLGGLPYKEIARIVGGTTDAARRAAADGIKSLRAALAGAGTAGG
jgi:RNA polymerase sigma factor (sigma-70 family)